MWRFAIRNIAGIRRGSVEISPGSNVIQASNWQGKTSLLKAMRAVLGGEIDKSVITKGETSGKVQLTTKDGEYSVTVRQRNNTVTRTGTPYLTGDHDQTCANLFAFLDEQNPIRQAVRNGENLTPILLRPIREQDIEEKIDTRRSERRTVESQLTEARKAADKLPRKEEEKTQLETEIADLRSELDDLQEGEETERDEIRRKLNEARTQLERAEQERERAAAQVSTYEDRLEKKKQELDELEVESDGDLQDELESKKSSRDEIQKQIKPLQNLWQANKDILEDGFVDTVSDVERNVDADYVTCWTCGSEVTRENIQSRVENLREKIQSLREREEELQSEIDELTSQKRKIERQKSKREELHNDIENYQQRLEEQRDTRDQAAEDVETWKQRVEEYEDQVQEVDDRQSDLEQQLARKEAQLETIKDELDDLEEAAAKRDELQDRIDELTGEIESLRGRREELIDEARDAFADAIEDTLNRFEPSIEASRLKKKTDPETGKTTELELVLVRDGREITVDALSEGEVELIGFVTALAGYEAFDVRERVPVMLLDDVGGLAAEHLSSLVHYLKGRTEFLVTTAYPEAGEFDGTVVSPDDWDVVSDRVEHPA